MVAHAQDHVEVVCRVQAEQRAVEVGREASDAAPKLAAAVVSLALGFFGSRVGPALQAGVKLPANCATQSPNGAIYVNHGE